MATDTRGQADSCCQKLFSKCFPGICRTLAASSQSNRAAKISEDDNSVSSFSTLSSM